MPPINVLKNSENLFDSVLSSGEIKGGRDRREKERRGEREEEQTEEQGGKKEQEI